MSDLYYLLNTHGIFILYACVLAYLWFIEKSYEETKHVIISAGVTALIGLVLKQIFSIPRPYLVYNIDPLAGYSVRTDSLPSLHAALAFSLATTVILHQRRLGIFLFLAAAIIGFGRVAANVHYPGDIIFGSVMGTAIGLMIEKWHVRKSRN